MSYQLVLEVIEDNLEIPFWHGRTNGCYITTLRAGLKKNLVRKQCVS